LRNAHEASNIILDNFKMPKRKSLRLGSVVLLKEGTNFHGHPVRRAQVASIRPLVLMFINKENKHVLVEAERRMIEEIF